MTVITNLSLYDRKDFLWTALLIYFPPNVHVCTLSFDDALRYMYYTAQLNFTCCTWFTCCSVSERRNILLARSFHAAHYDRDSCEKSAWKYRGNIVRWTWILQRFNEERNPFLVFGKTWLIITFRCVYCISQATSEGSGEPAHLRSLARAFAGHTHEARRQTKGPTKHQTTIPPPGWLPMCVWRIRLRRTKSTIILLDGSIRYMKLHLYSSVDRWRWRHVVVEVKRKKSCVTRNISARPSASTWGIVANISAKERLAVFPFPNINEV